MATVGPRSRSEQVRMAALALTFTPELVDLVVEEAGARQERTNILPASLMVCFVLSMWLSATLLAPLIGALTGFVAGAYPDLRAARIEPLEALRR